MVSLFLLCVWFPVSPSGLHPALHLSHTLCSSQHIATSPIPLGLSTRIGEGNKHWAHGLADEIVFVQEKGKGICLHEKQRMEKEGRWGEEAQEASTHGTKKPQITQSWFLAVFGPKRPLSGPRTHL